jgi:aspartate aminotransferase
VYSNLTKISESVSVSFADYVRKREAEGLQLIKMQTGDPDFATHSSIVKAAETAMASGLTKYCESRGLKILRSAIACKLKSENGIAADPDREILVTHGAVHAINLMIRAVAESGDEVIVCEPYWRTYVSDVILSGATPIVVKLDSDSGFQLDADKILSAITPRTRAIVINSPNNPTGAVYDERQLRALATAAAKRGIFLISDEVYENIVFENRRHYSPGSDPAVAHFVATAFSFSKTHAMTGWRIGYLVANHSIIDALLKLSQYSVTSLSPFIQLAAATALTDSEAQAYSQKMRTEYETRRSLIANKTKGTWLEEAMPVPQGTFYTLIDCTPLATPSDELARHLIDRAGVALTPGIAFGDSMDNYLRMCFATSEQNIERSINALLDLN